MILKKRNFPVPREKEKKKNINPQSNNMENKQQRNRHNNKRGAFKKPSFFPPYGFLKQDPD